MGGPPPLLLPAADAAPPLPPNIPAKGLEPANGLAGGVRDSEGAGPPCGSVPVGGTSNEANGLARGGRGAAGIGGAVASNEANGLARGGRGAEGKGAGAAVSAACRSWGGAGATPKEANAAPSPPAWKGLTGWCCGGAAWGAIAAGGGCCRCCADASAFKSSKENQPWSPEAITVLVEQDHAEGNHAGNEHAISTCKCLFVSSANSRCASLELLIPGVSKRSALERVRLCPDLVSRVSGARGCSR